jgi:hypothetical protein
MAAKVAQAQKLIAAAFPEEVGDGCEGCQLLSRILDSGVYGAAHQRVSESLAFMMPLLSMELSAGSVVKDVVAAARIAAYMIVANTLLTLTGATRNPEAHERECDKANEILAQLLEQKFDTRQIIIVLAAMITAIMHLGARALAESAPPKGRDE